MQHLLMTRSVRMLSSFLLHTQHTTIVAHSYPHRISPHLTASNPITHTSLATTRVTNAPV